MAERLFLVLHEPAQQLGSPADHAISVIAQHHAPVGMCRCMLHTTHTHPVLGEWWVLGGGGWWVVGGGTHLLAPFSRSNVTTPLHIREREGLCLAG